MLVRGMSPARARQTSRAGPLGPPWFTQTLGICANDAGLVHRFTPDGKLDRSLAVPAAKPAMCAFGGPGLDRLYVTTIAPAAPIAGYDPSLAGAVFVLNPHCTGLVDTAYAG